jgi:SsrA-binding protein
MTRNDSPRNLATNRRARHDYHVLETMEAGLVLLGTEVKSIREGKVQLRDSFVEIRDGEAWMIGAHVSPYTHGNRENHDPDRPRKLLLKRREIERLFGRTLQKGFTVVPLRLYLKGNRIKAEIALVRGKKLHDKREAERQRELDREVEETLAKRNW